MDQTHKRWTDLRSDGSPKHKEGDLFWVDADSTIRVVVRCSGCGKGFLGLWTSKPVKTLTCKVCVGKAKK